MGHNTARTTMFTTLLTFQVLKYLIPGPVCPSLTTESPPGTAYLHETSSPPTPLPPTKPNGISRLFPARARHTTWQPWNSPTSATTGPHRAQYKQQGIADYMGHNTARTTMFTTLLTFQVLKYLLPGPVCPSLTAESPPGTAYLHETSSPPTPLPPTKPNGISRLFPARARHTTWQPWNSPTSATTGPHRAQYKQQGIADYMGHNTARITMFTTLLTFQVLTYLLPGPVCPSLTAESPPGTAYLHETSSPPTPLPPTKPNGISRLFPARARHTTWQPWNSPTSATTGPHRAQYKQQGIADYMGHNTARITMFTTLLTFQVLTYLLPGPVCPSLTAESPPGTAYLHETSSPPTPLPPTKPNGISRLFPARARHTTWQPWNSPTSATTGPHRAQYKQQGIADYMGHNTARTTMFTTLLTFQVLKYLIPGPVCPSLTTESPPGTAYLHETSSPPTPLPPTKPNGISRLFPARARHTTWQPWNSPTSATTGPHRAQYKQQGIADYMGHNTARTTMFTTLLTFQVLKYLIPGPVCPSLTTESPPGTAYLHETSSPPTPLPPTKPNGISRLFPARARHTTWQPWNSPTSATTGPHRAQYKQQRIADYMGHNTARTTMFTTLLTFQVCYRTHSKEFRSDDRCIVAVSCPYDLKCRGVVLFCRDAFAFDFLCEIML
ncbi:mucin-2-like [Dermacentor albipictus]|uniref:mucin-2-like n=1 Tax=Dermacentor albipictus TaxID=60249 RepID=UPI0038FCDFB0